MASGPFTSGAARARRAPTSMRQSPRWRRGEAEIDLLYSERHQPRHPGRRGARAALCLDGPAARGAQVVFDNNYRPRLWPSRAEACAVFDRAFSLASTVLITLDDHQLLYGHASLDRSTDRRAGPGARRDRDQARRRTDARARRAARPGWRWRPSGWKRVVDHSRRRATPLAPATCRDELCGASSAEAAAFGNRSRGARDPAPRRGDPAGHARPDEA